MVESLLTKSDVSQLTKITPRTIDRLRRADAMPAPVYLGTGAKKRVRWRASQVDKWVRWGCPCRLAFEALIREQEGVSA